MPRFAIVVVVDADFAEVAREAVGVRLGTLAPQPGENRVASWVGEACPIPETDRDVTYETRQITLLGPNPHPIETAPEF